MNERDTSPIGFFQKYLTVWVILCMAAVSYTHLTLPTKLVV